MNRLLLLFTLVICLGLPPSIADARCRRCCHRYYCQPVCVPTCCVAQGEKRVSCDDARNDVQSNYADHEWGSCDFPEQGTADAYAVATLAPKLVIRHGTQGTITSGHKIINHGFPAPNTYMPYAGWNP
jgi:hypothetical protein